MKSNEPALSGLTVLDLSEGYAGGYCTKILRDLGASVIKVEIPKRGDVCRSYGPFLNNDPNLETSAPFLYLNAGKKSIIPSSSGLNEKLKGIDNSLFFSDHTNAKSDAHGVLELADIGNACCSFQ